MSLANLFNIPKDQNEWNVWSFSHMDHHRLIICAAKAQKGLLLPEFILDPIPFGALTRWLYAHQQMHDDGVSFGLGGFDLTGLDPKDEGQIAAWIRLNAIGHQNAALELSI